MVINGVVNLFITPAFARDLGLLMVKVLNASGLGCENSLVSHDHQRCISYLFPHELLTHGSLQRSRRIWLIDRQTASIGQDLRQDLGNWIRRRLSKGVEGQAKKARITLDDCGVSVEELRQQWILQQAAQLSVRARMFSACNIFMRLIIFFVRCSRTPKKGIRHCSHTSRRLRVCRQCHSNCTGNHKEVIAFTGVIGLTSKFATHTRQPQDQGRSIVFVFER